MNYLIQSSMCLLLCHGFYFFFFRKDTFFQRNRIYLNLSLVVSLIMPLVKFPSLFGQFTPWYNTLATTLSPIMLPEQTLGVTMLEEVTITAENIRPFLPQLSWFGWVYVLGAAFFAIKLLISIIKISLFIRQSEVNHKVEYYEVLTEGKLPTFSFFNYLFWDNKVKLTAEEEEQVRQHELAHIKGFHSIDLLFIELVKIIFWFNPAVYFFQIALINQHEFIADRAVLHQTEFKTYARFVVQSIFQNTSLRVVHNFNQSQLKTRIAMMKKNQTPKKFALKALLVLPFTLLGLMFSCEDGYIAGEQQSTEPTISFENKLEFDSEIIVAQVDNNATPKEGFGSLFSRLTEEIKMPKDVEGKVYIQFIIDEKGKLRNAAVLKGVEENLDQQVLASFVKVAATDWNPGTKEDKPVAQRMVLPILLSQDFKKTDEVEIERIESKVDNPPVPKEGLQAFMQELSANIQYPKAAKNEGIEGTVFLQFVVDKDGKVGNIEVARSLNEVCDKAAVEALSSLNLEWTPAEKDGKAVSNKMILPVKFKID